jgi:hypothetical protein
VGSLVKSAIELGHQVSPLTEAAQIPLAHSLLNVNTTNHVWL